MEPARYPVPELLQKMEDRLEGNQERLAGYIGASQPQISRWKAGAEPKMRNYLRITDAAERLGVIGDVQSEDVAATLRASIPGPMMRIVGYVGAGAEAHYYALSDEDFEEVPRPADASDKAVALEIRGKSWGPLMESWVVYYDDVRSPVTPDLLNRVCIVGLADDRILIKEIRSDGTGGYDLFPNTTTDEVIRDAEIEWAAKVVGMKPR